MSIVNNIHSLIDGSIARELSESREVLKHTAGVLHTIAALQAQHSEHIERLDASLRHIVKFIDIARFERDVADLIAESVGGVRDQLSDLADRIEEVDNAVVDLAEEIQARRFDSLNSLSDRVDVLELAYEAHDERLDALNVKVAPLLAERRPSSTGSL